MAALQEALEAAKREGKTPFFVGATAGTTVTGAFDPLEPLAQVSSHQVPVPQKRLPHAVHVPFAQKQYIEAVCSVEQHPVEQHNMAHTQTHRPQLAVG